MNICTSHIASNSGFRTKHVTVTYDKLKESRESLGQVPVTDDFYYRQDPAHFVASTLKNPVPYRDRPSQEMMVTNPVLDAAGKPIIETVTETIELPGAKKTALSWAGNVLGVTATFGAMMGIVMGGAGALCGALTAAPMAGFQIGLLAAAASTVLMTGPATVAGLTEAVKTFAGTNTLDMQQTPIVSKELQGYQVSTDFTGFGDPYIDLEPRVKETPLGVWQKPTVTYA